jgi:hypothetical protein
MSWVHGTSALLGNKQLCWKVSIFDDFEYHGQPRYHRTTVEGRPGESLIALIQRASAFHQVTILSKAARASEFEGAEYFDPKGVPIPCPHISLLIENIK